MDRELPRRSKWNIHYRDFVAKSCQDLLGGPARFELPSKGL